MSSDPHLGSRLLAMRTANNDNNNKSTTLPAPSSEGHSEKDNVPGSGAGREDKNKATLASSTSVYRDFSRVLPEKHNDASSLIAQSTTAKEPTFPVKLHMILSNPEFQDIIAWLPHGRSWRILQQKAFEERVIPLYFRHGRYSSFARQVNGWGFKRITHGSDYNSYYHELFLRGMAHLCDKMRRLTTKDLSKKKKMEDGPTPDFYALSQDNPLPESTSVPTTALTTPVLAGGRAGADMTNADMELALLERRRADIFNRMNLFAGSNVMNPNAFSAPGHQIPGQQDMNSNSLVAAAALSLGNNGRPSTITSAGSSGLQQQILGGMPSVGQFFDNSNSALQRQLLEARLANSEMATILGLGGGSNMQNNSGMNGIPGLMMPPNL